MRLHRVFRISLLSLFLCLLSSVAASQVVEDILVIGQPGTFDAIWNANTNSLSYNGMDNRTPAHTSGEYMARLRARQQCEKQVGEATFGFCREVTEEVYEAAIDSCNVGAMMGAGVGSLALATGGVMVAGATALAFAGPAGWIVIGVGVAAHVYGVHQMTACRDHAGRDLANNLSSCSSTTGATVKKICGSIMAY